MFPSIKRVSPFTGFCRLLAATAIVAFGFAQASLRAENWPQFRGPDGAGVSPATNLPATWSATENIAWKVEMPGYGASSPVVFNDRIYVTSYSGYGLDEKKPGDQAELRRHLSCYKLDSGELEWTKTMEPKSPQKPYRQFVALHGYVSSTPAVDKTGIYVFYGASGAAAYSHSGELLWEADCGQGTHDFGTANSPVIFEDVVIINASVESGNLIGLDKKSGKEIWRQSDIRSSWNTPALVKAANGETEVAVNTKGKILAFDPRTGEKLWFCTAMDDYICPSLLAHDDVVYAIGSRKNSAIAVRAGGRGDVTETHKLWQLGKGSNVTSPVYYEGHLYWSSEGRGVVYCVDASNGEVVYEERLDPSPDRIYASPVVADGKIYYVSRNKGTYVVAAKPEFELLAHNTMEGDDSVFNGSPAIVGNRIILRSDRFLYCISKE